jgi:hypothetical protein
MRPRSVFILAIGALLFCFVLPPAGAVLGLLAAGLALKLLSTPPPPPRTATAADGSLILEPVPVRGRGLSIASLVLAVGAVLLGLAVSISLVFFWDEVSTYTECREQANTIQGEKKCEDALRDAILN